MSRNQSRREAANGVPARGNRLAHPWRNLSPRERAGMVWHDARWQLASSEFLSAWIDRKLQLGSWYWLFLLGLNNSGTTLVKKVLRQHPLIRSFRREGQRMTDVFPHPSKLGMGDIWGNAAGFFHMTENSDPRPASRAKYDWARLYPSGEGALLEKSPTHTLRSRWLQQHFQPSRFVAVVRSPYAVCEGIRRRAGCSIASAANHWTAGNGCLLRDKNHLERFMWLRYEDFCESPAECLHELQTFLDLPTAFDLEVLENVSSHSIAGRSVGLQNLNSQSIERLTPEDVRSINRIAAPVMEELGYERL